MKCKHGLTKQWCSLCLGYPQSEYNPSSSPFLSNHSSLLVGRPQVSLQGNPQRGDTWCYHPDNEAKMENGYTPGMGNLKK